MPRLAEASVPRKVEVLGDYSLLKNTWERGVNRRRIRVVGQFEMKVTFRMSITELVRTNIDNVLCILSSCFESRIPVFQYLELPNTKRNMEGY